VRSRLNVRTIVVSGVCRCPEDYPVAHRELREIDELARSFGWAGGVLAARYRLGKIRQLIRQDPTTLDCLLQARMAFQVLDLAGW